MLQPSVFRLPKAGSTQAEYEDAVAWSRRRGRFAVADGASASAFARLWAQLLVQAYVGGRLSPCAIENDLAPVQARWSALVEQRNLPWYAVEQARRGAFAALVGLEMHADRTWTALAVGDCCLFQVRDHTLLEAMPLSDAEAFNLRPMLLGSRASANTVLRDAGAIVTASGTWAVGDTFLLMSDALAAMFLRAASASAESPLHVFAFDRSPLAFRLWVHSARSAQFLRNDDASLLWLEVGVDAAA